MAEAASPEPIVITGIGMVTSIGYETAVAATSVRAGLQRFVELEEEFDRNEEPIVAAPVALLEDDPSGQIVMMNMAAAEAFAMAFGSAEKAPQPLWASVSVGAQADGDPPPLGRYPLERLQAALDHVPLHGESEIRAGCRTAVFEAIAGGMKRLRDRKAAACLVGGVDSLIQTHRLTRLEGQKRLKTGYNPHGLIPGEASVFLVLERESDARARGADCWARLNEVGLADEANPLGSPKPCLGQGLSEAIRQASRAHCDPPRPLLGVLCDLNGEPYRASEWGLARPRALGWARDVTVWHPADCWGDIGAATGAALLALGAFALHEGFAPTPELLVWAGSEGGQRAAVFLTPVMNGKWSHAGHGQRQ